MYLYLLFTNDKIKFDQVSFWTFINVLKGFNYSQLCTYYLIFIPLSCIFFDQMIAMKQAPFLENITQSVWFFSIIWIGYLQGVRWMYCSIWFVLIHSCLFSTGVFYQKKISSLSFIHQETLDNFRLKTRKNA